MRLADVGIAASAPESPDGIGIVNDYANVHVLF